MTKHKNYLFTLFTMAIGIALLSACVSRNNETGSAPTNEGQAETALAISKATSDNPPLPGFNESASDPEAMALADDVMNAMGGRAAWDETRYLSWVFFGSRRLTWDKFTGDVRIDQFRDSDLKILVNVHSGNGKVFKDGEEIVQPDSLTKYLDRGKRIWINDSYWLVMPFKLKDSGVTLTYQGTGVAQDSTPVDVLQLTFQEVGVTPENKYLVCVDKNTSLVCEWSFFSKATDEAPRFTMPWHDYKERGDILLSGNRGERELSKIMVLDELPAETFTAFDEPDLQAVL